MKKQKHIIWITPGFPEGKSDTRCIPPLQSLALGLSKQSGFKLSVIAVHYPYTERSYIWNGIPVYACGGNNCKLIFRPKIWKRTKKQFEQFNKGTKVDAIHSFWLSECAWLGQKLGKQFGVPHITTLMGQEGLKSNIYERWIKKDRLTLVAISQFQAELFEKRTKRKPDIIIPWGLDLENLSHTGNENREIDLLGVGSLIKLKDYASFIEIAGNLKNDYSGIRCEILGEGPERKELERMVIKKGLSENIQFRGFVSREEVLEKMSKSRVLLHPSTYESFGFVFLEGLYYGLQLVSREVGIARQTGQWQLADSIDEFERCVRMALEKNDFLSKVLADQKETIDTYANLYTEVLGN